MQQRWWPCLLALVALVGVASAAHTTPARTRLATASRLRGGSDDEASSSSSSAGVKASGSGSGRGSGRGSGGRGRGRGRGPPGYYRAPAPQQINTVVLGDAIRNLTTWTDVDASRTVFAVGNAIFLAFFLGKKALLLLWMGFIAAFVVKSPLKFDQIDVEALTAAAREALHACAGALKAATVAVRERLAPSPLAE